jgi:hypothetical protein
MLTKAIQKRKLPGKGIFGNFVIFLPAVSCKRVDNFNFRSDLTSSRAHVNGPLLGEVSLALPLSSDWMFKA